MKNESVKKSLEKIKKSSRREAQKQSSEKKSSEENLHKKDQHVYNNCYELCSRAINHFSGLY